jgi:hypothetical protein
MESGLKQRKVAHESHSVSSTKHDSDGGESNRFDKDIDREEESDEYDADSKETRLTLMEEVLLLGLKDREVCLFANPIGQLLNSN